MNEELKTQELHDEELEETVGGFNPLKAINALMFGKGPEKADDLVNLTIDGEDNTLIAHTLPNVPGAGADMRNAKFNPGKKQNGPVNL